MLLKEHNNLHANLLIFEDLEKLYNIEIIDSSYNDYIYGEMDSKQCLETYKEVIANINEFKYDPCCKFNLFNLKDELHRLIENQKIGESTLKSNIFKPLYSVLNNKRIINEVIKLSVCSQEYFDVFYRMLTVNHNFYYENLSVINNLYAHLARGKDYRGNPLIIPADFTDRLIKSIDSNKIINKLDLYREIIFNEDDFQNNQLIYFLNNNKDINLNTIFNIAVCLENKTIINYVNNMNDFNINNIDENGSNIFDAIRNTNDFEIVNLILNHPELKGEIEAFIPYLIQIGARDEVIKYIDDKRFEIRDLKKLIVNINDSIGISCYNKMKLKGTSKNKIIKENSLLAKKLSESLLNRLEFSFRNSNNFNDLSQLANFKFDEQRTKKLIRYNPNN